MAVKIREEQLKRVADLKRGDIVRNIGSGISYVVEATYGDTATAVISVQITNPPEWVVVRRVDG